MELRVRSHRTFILVNRDRLNFYQSCQKFLLEAIRKLFGRCSLNFKLIQGASALSPTTILATSKETGKKIWHSHGTVNGCEQNYDIWSRSCQIWILNFSKVVLSSKLEAFDIDSDDHASVGHFSCHCEKWFHRMFWWRTCRKSQPLLKYFFTTPLCRLKVYLNIPTSPKLIDSVRQGIYFASQRIQ